MERSRKRIINARDTTRNVTITDIARRAGVSVTTVSAALGGPGRVSSERQAQIQALAAEMGYQPSLAARLLRSRQTGQIGLVVGGGEPGELAVGGFWGPILAQFVASCGQMAQAYHIEFYQAQSASPAPRQILGRLVDGTIVAGVVDTALRAWLAGQTEYPWVSLDEPGETAVYSAADAGIYEAARHLAALGHRRVAYLGGPRQYQTHELGAQGFERAKREFGFECPPERELFIVGTANTDVAVEQLRLAQALLAGPQRPTAVICHGVPTARAVVFAAAERGWRVPADLSVIGYGVGTDALQSYPALACVEPDFPALVGKAIELLRERLAGREPAARQVAVKPQLILRDSVARLG